MKRDREWKVTSLELSKQIDVEHKRLGLRVESELVWHEGELWHYSNVERYESIPAYDTAELGEMLPYHIRYSCLEEKRITDTEAEARGKMYLCLLQNGHIEKEEL